MMRALNPPFNHSHWRWINQFRRMRGNVDTDFKGVTDKDIMHFVKKKKSVRSDTRRLHIITDECCADLIGLIVGHQLVDGCSFGYLQQDGLWLLPALHCSRAHVTEVTGARTLALAGAVHADASCHALCTCVQQTGDVCRVGERSGLLVALLWLLRRWVTCDRTKTLSLLWHKQTIGRWWDHTMVVMR